MKCIGCVRKFAMHFGGFETAKEIFFDLHFVLLIYYKAEHKNSNNLLIYYLRIINLCIKTFFFNIDIFLSCHSGLKSENIGDCDFSKLTMELIKKSNEFYGIINTLKDFQDEINLAIYSFIFN